MEFFKKVKVPLINRIKLLKNRTELFKKINISKFSGLFSQN